MRSAKILFLPALVSVLVLGVGEAAQAACYGPGQQLPAHVVSQFINDPGKLLAQFPGGGAQMSSLVRDLVASDPGALPLIINLNGKANTEQVQAIGAGLGQAALVCARTAQAFADEIQRVTIAANNKPMTQALGAVMGDQFLGLAGPAVGGGGAGATGQVVSTGGLTAGSVPLNLTTSVSSVTTASVSNITSTSSGITPSAATGVGSSGPGGLASVGSLGGSASAGSRGASTIAESAGGSLFAGNGGNSIFGASANSSGKPSTLGSVNTPNLTSNITANITANTNSAISVSPSRPR
jgi:hypothetical protein